MDIFETGHINKDTLLITFQRKGRSVQVSEIEAMLREVGFATDINIDYATFEKLIVAPEAAPKV